MRRSDTRATGIPTLRARSLRGVWGSEVFDGDAGVEVLAQDRFEGALIDDLELARFEREVCAVLGVRRHR